MAGLTTSREQVNPVSGEKRTDESVMDQWLEMFALFAHDLESPLASMKYVLKLLENGKLDLSLPRHRQLVESSRVAVERAESILYDSIAVARSGKLGLQAQLADLHLKPILVEAATLATGAAAPNQIAVVAVEPVPAVRIQADAHLLRRLLDNLLFNAIRHTPADGTIRLYAEEKGARIQINIKDSGNGLGDVDPNLLFEKYGQIKMRAEGTHRGVGLGLYFCRLAATAMGGSVSAANHPDGGAIFSLLLNKSKGD